MKIKHCTSYQSIPRALVFDPLLSFQAKFLYIYMMSKPDGWDYYQQHMCREIGVSKMTLIKYEKELIKSGWIKVVPGGRNEDGTFSTNCYEIFDVNPLRNNTPYTDTESNNCTGTESKNYHTVNSIPKDNIDIDVDKRESIKGNAPFVCENPAFQPLVDKWLQYKKAKKQSYKTNASIKTFYKRLIELSGNNIEMAGKIIEASIANNYSGIFPLKVNYSNGTARNNNTSNSHVEQQNQFEQRLHSAADVIKNLATEDLGVDF